MTVRAAVYARYSSDAQNAASIEDQICGIRAKADGDSDARRTLIPTEAGR